MTVQFNSSTPSPNPTIIQSQQVSQSGLVKKSASPKPPPKTENSDKAPTSKALRILGGDVDTTKVLSLLKATHGSTLQERVNTLSSKTFFSKGTKWVHKLFNTQTYQNYQSQKGQLKEISSLRQQADQLRFQSENLEGSPEEIQNQKTQLSQKAAFLSAKADIFEFNYSGLIDDGVMRSYETLTKTPDGLTALDKAGILSPEKIAEAKKTFTFGDLQQTNRLNQALIQSHAPETQTKITQSMEKLKAYTDGETEISKLLLKGRFNPDHVIQDKSTLSKTIAESFYFEYFAEACHDEQEVHFLLDIQTLSSRDTAPTLGDLKGLHEKYMVGDGRLNINKKYIDTFAKALEHEDLAGALDALYKVTKATDEFARTGALERFKEFQQGINTLSSHHKLQGVDTKLSGMKYPDFTKLLQQIRNQAIEKTTMDYLSQQRYDQLMDTLEELGI